MSTVFRFYNFRFSKIAVAACIICKNIKRPQGFYPCGRLQNKIFNGYRRHRRRSHRHQSRQSCLRRRFFR